MKKSDAIAFSSFFHFWKKKNSAVLRYVSTSKMTWNVLFFIFFSLFFTIKNHNKIRCYSFLALFKMINFLRNFYGIFYGIFFQNSKFFFSKTFKISFLYMIFYNIFIGLILLLNHYKKYSLYKIMIPLLEYKIKKFHFFLKNSYFSIYFLNLLI